MKGLEKLKKIGLCFRGCIRTKNVIWFPAMNYNGLYQYNLENGVTKRIDDFPNEELWQEDLYHNVCLYQHSLVFIPHFAKRLAIYDIDQEIFRQVEMPNYCLEQSDVANFLEGVVYQDKVYVVGYRFPGIIKVDLSTNETKIVYEVTENAGYDGKYSVYFGNKAAIDGNLLYIPCLYRNSVLIFDMDCDKAIQVEIGEGFSRYTRIVRDDSKFYLMTKDTNHLVFWDKNNSDWYEIELNFRKSYIDAFICFNEEYIWAISPVSGEIYRIEKANNKAHYIDLNRALCIEYVGLYRDGICFIDYDTGNWHYLDSQDVIIDLQVKITEPRETEEIWIGLKHAYLEIVENGRTPIQYLIFRIMGEGDTALRQSKRKQSVGKKIWKAICKEV